MSMAAAWNMKKRAKKMAEGGDVGSGKQRSDNERGVHQESHSYGSTSSSGAGDLVRSGAYKTSGNMRMGGPKARMQAGIKNEHKRVLSEAKTMPGPTTGVSGFAHGGDVGDADMIARILHKRKQYSEGGMVANDVGTGQEADKLPNQLDDLVLRDDLESSYDGANSGDELGSKLNQEKGDVISKIMGKRRK